MDVVLDQIQDTTGREIHRLTSLYPPPDFVKTASHDNICGTSEALPAHLYGDSIKRTYPCHNPAATWMSAAFFGDKQASYNQDSSQRIKSNILRCAIYYGIGGQVTALMDKIATDSRDTMESLPDSDFAWDQVVRFLVFFHSDGIQHLRDYCDPLITQFSKNVDGV